MKVASQKHWEITDIINWLDPLFILNRSLGDYVENSLYFVSWSKLELSDSAI